MMRTDPYWERIEALSHALRSADAVIVGAGSGLSTAAGLDYAGEDFRRLFAPWIRRYGFTDLYTSAFYPFETEEERWAYWAEHIWFCRYRTGGTPLYRQLSGLLEGKDLFVVTTNTDAQFELSGFDTDRIFATQGDYSLFQPATGSPKTLVSNREWVMQTLPQIHDCRIPTSLIPRMPDGQPVAMNLRVDDTFVEDYRWHRQSKRYTDFVHGASSGKLLLLEFGIGFNTPGIIRLPFEQMASLFPDTTLVRFNRDYPDPSVQGISRFIPFTEPIGSVLSEVQTAHHQPPANK
ncbi:MAG: Sir2 silent information regulator family NAD-dependent deacetylase [Bacteroidales bacterium]|nr:Sir2 silent information regulator family NAD-dependent deacetylase [Bacteroidales bacterium]